MIVQIYSLTHSADVRSCVEAGVDHLGVAAGDQNVPASISNERARTLFREVPDGHKTVALSVHSDVDRIAEYARDVRPDVIHVCADTDAVDGTDLRELGRRLPDEMDLMRAIDVDGAASIDTALALDDVCDWFILDTVTADVQGIGASGETHDWSISRRIVEETETPVILAGGLAPGNVADAVREVDPAGVDSYTHTSRSERRKDAEAVRAFVENARTA